MKKGVNKQILVAYLGPEGTFCEQAARNYFSKAFFIPYPDITDTFTAVEDKNADYGVVPAENSTEGSIGETLDCLLKSRIKICGEIELKIIHNLIAKPSTDIDKIRIILSHPQALAQCRRFLKNTFPSVELREVSSTAKAVGLLRNLDDAAAIGTDIVAKRSGMTVLRSQIEDELNNLTRFFILRGYDAKPTNKDKTSIAFSTRHMPGALYKVLEVFAIRHINLTKIESRPDKKNPWNYVFYLDFEGHRTDIKIKDALDAIKERCLYVKVLGSYPRDSQQNPFVE